MVLSVCDIMAVDSLSASSASCNYVICYRTFLDDGEPPQLLNWLPEFGTLPSSLVTL